LGWIIALLLFSGVVVVTGRHEGQSKGEYFLNLPIHFPLAVSRAAAVERIALGFAHSLNLYFSFAHYRLRFGNRNRYKKLALVRRTKHTSIICSREKESRTTM
jgi:hypothetical protein